MDIDEEDNGIALGNNSVQMVTVGDEREINN